MENMYRNSIKKTVTEDLNIPETFMFLDKKTQTSKGVNSLLS